MTASQRIFLLYVALLSALSVVAAPVNYGVAQSVGARRDAPLLHGRAKAAPVKALPAKVTPAKVTPVKVTPVKTTPPVVKTTAPATTVSQSSSVLSSTQASTTPAVLSSSVSTSLASSATLSIASSATSSIASSSPLTESASATSTASNATATDVLSCPIKTTTKPRARQLETPKDLIRRTLTADVPHQVSLLRQKVGTSEEHWALFFHPSAANPDGTFTGTIIDAVTENDQVPKNSVLVVDEREDKTRGPQSNPATGRIDTITPIATVANGAAAEALITKAKAAKPTRKPPAQNCVDYTNLAVSAMAGSARTGGLSSSDVRAFQVIYNANKNTVRSATACNFACRTEGEDDA